MSHDERFKGRDKKTHKMTRDGLVERNAATGEESRISQRRQDFKLRDRLTEGAAGRGSVLDSERGARSQCRPQDFKREETIPRTEQPRTADLQDTRQMDADFRSSDTAHTTSEAPHTLDADAKTLSAEPAISQRGGGQTRPSRQHGSRYQRQFQSDAQGDTDLPARNADTSPISDVPPFQVTLSIPPTERISGDLPLSESPTSAGDEISDTPPTLERPGRLLFDVSAQATPAGTKPNQRGTGYARKFMEKQPEEAVGGADRQGTSAPDSHSDSTPDSKPAKPSRLQFGKEELPPPKDMGAGSAGKMVKRLEKSRLKAEHPAKKLAATKKKLPTRKKLRLEKSFDAEHGEVKRQLRFEQEVKSQRAHLKGPVPTRPVKAGANAAIGYAHTKIHQAEQENVGVEAGHKGELMAEGLARRAYTLVVLYYPEISAYVFQMNINGEQMNYIYNAADGTFMVDSNSRERFERMITEALGETGETGETDALLAPIPVFDNTIRETFGMTADALYALPFEQAAAQPEQTPPAYALPYEPLGFTANEDEAACLYEKSGLRIAIHRPEWGASPEEWNIKFHDPDVNGYSLVMQYYAGEGKWHVSMEKGGAYCAYDDYPATDTKGWEDPGIEAVHQMVGDAFHSQGKELYYKPLEYFEQVVQELFGMTVEELYALPAGK